MWVCQLLLYTHCFLHPVHCEVTPHLAINFLECNDWLCPVALARLLECLGHTRGSSKRVRESPRVQAVLMLLTHRPEPPEGQGEAKARPEPNKILMAFDSNFSTVHSPCGPASGKIGCLLLPIKHTTYAHKSRWMVSLCSGSVFVHEWEKLGSRTEEQEMGRPCQLRDSPGNCAKRFGCFPSATPSVQARVQTIGGTYSENHVLTYSQIVKGVYVYLGPGE